MVENNQVPASQIRDVLMEKEVKFLDALREALINNEYEHRIAIELKTGETLSGREASTHILDQQDLNKLIVEPNATIGYLLRIWSGLTKTSMAELTGIHQNYQWSRFEKGEKDINSEAWTLMMLRFGIHPSYELVLKKNKQPIVKHIGIDTTAK